LKRAADYARERLLFDRPISMGYAEEFHVERYMRECLIHRLAPISPQLILSYLAERALDLPKSY